MDPSLRWDDGSGGEPIIQVIERHPSEGWDPYLARPKSFQKHSRHSSNTIVIPANAGIHI